jgi:hypothetical protein
VWRSFWIAQLAARANLKFQAYLAAGFGIWLGCQALINIGVKHWYDPCIKPRTGMAGCKEAQPSQTRGGSSRKKCVMERPESQAIEVDRELERRITSFLAGRHVPGLRSLEVHARNGVVTVRGRVMTFYEKQLCNQCCRRVAGVLQLINEVDVIGTMPGAAVVA